MSRGKPTETCDAGNDLTFSAEGIRRHNRYCLAASYAGRRDRAIGMKRSGRWVLACLCLTTGLHYAAAYMRIPIIPLYASSVGANAAEIGLVSGLHMLVTAVAAIPVSFAAARWGRRGFVLGGTALGMVSSFFIPIFDNVAALAVIYAVAGLAFAAFTPSTMSLTADVAAPGHV